jgi:WD40 repeat protein
MINFWNGNGDCISSQTAHRGYVSYLSDFSSSLFNNNIPQVRRGGRPLTATNPLLFLSVGSDSVIKLWDVKRCRSVAEIQPTSTPTTTPGTASSSSNITKTTWCSEGNTFLSASSNGHIRHYEKSDLAPPATSHGLSQPQQQQQLNSSGMGGVNNDWNNQDLASLPGSCTDLVSSVGIAACGSKAGKIMRWEW